MSEDKLKQIIRECVIETMRDIEESRKRNLIFETNMNEMGKINIHPEGREEVLPYPRFFLFVSNGDHNPPHLHVQKKDNTYHATFRIDNGKVLDIKTKHHLDVQTHSFCVREIPKWLDDETLVRGLTNREVCMGEWQRENPDLPIIWNV